MTSCPLGVRCTRRRCPRWRWLRPTCHVPMSRRRCCRARSRCRSRTSTTPRGRSGRRGPSPSCGRAGDATPPRLRPRGPQPVAPVRCSRQPRPRHPVHGRAAAPPKPAPTPPPHQLHPRRAARGVLRRRRRWLQSARRLGCSWSPWPRPTRPLGAPLAAPRACARTSSSRNALNVGAHHRQPPAAATAQRCQRSTWTRTPPPARAGRAGGPGHGTCVGAPKGHFSSLRECTAHIG